MEKDIRLNRRLHDGEPKCFTCGWWRAQPGQTIAPCDRNTTTEHQVATLDMQVCSSWRRNNDPDGDIWQDE